MTMVFVGGFWGSWCLFAVKFGELRPKCLPHLKFLKGTLFGLFSFTLNPL